MSRVKWKGPYVKTDLLKKIIDDSSVTKKLLKPFQEIR